MKTAYFLFILITTLITHHALAEQEACIILSKDIIPYHKAAAGIKEKLSEFRIKEYNLESESDQGQNILKVLEQNSPRLILAVGPEAASLLQNFVAPSPRVFTMILNPEKLFPTALPFPGVSLNYPPAAMLTFLKKAFPDREKVGIFYSPDSNSSLVEVFEKESEKIGLKIRPFPIDSSAQIQSTLKSPHFDPDTTLFIPDRVIIREKLISYIIEECLFRKVPAVGFNTWFVKNGALVAFYLDYEEVGVQTAELALKLLENKDLEPWIEPPRNLKIILNLKIARKFEIRIADAIKAEADQIIE